MVTENIIETDIKENKMKKKIIEIGRAAIVITPPLALLVYLIFFLPPVKAVPAPLDTYHGRWYLIRETANEDGATFAATYPLITAGNYANKDSSTVANGGPYHIYSYAGSGDGTEFQSSGGAWMFAICGKNYNATDDTFSFNIVGWGRENGMLQNIAEGNGVLGTQAVVVYPDGGDAMGESVDDSTAVYTHSDKTFTVTNEAFANATVNTLAYVTSTDANLTSGYYEITTVTDSNAIIMSGASSTGDVATGGVRVQSNPAFWADTINLDETTKWPSVAVYNSGDNEVAFIVVDMTGLEWVQFVVYDADAESGEEAGSITVYGRLY